MGRIPSKFWTGLAVAAAVLYARSAAADCARPFDDPNDVLTFHLKMKRADWDKMKVESVPDGECTKQNPYYAADFKCGDEPTWLKIGVRKKRGDQRGRDTDHKPPIKLDFNHSVNGQSWPASMAGNGYRKLSMNNGNPDNPGGILNILLTEHMALRFLKREVPQTPSTAFAKLYVEFDDGKTEYHGLYVLIEDIDRGAIRRRWGVADGRLAKTTWGTCEDTVYDDGGNNDAQKAWKAWLSKSPSGDWLTETAKSVELEDFLRQEAARDMLGNSSDTPTGKYYSNFLTFDPARPGAKRWFIPWDVDDCLGQGSRPPPTTPIIPSCSPIGMKTRCLSGPVQTRYLEIMCQLTNGPLNEKRLVAEWDAVDKIIRPIVAEEKDPVWGGRDPLGPMGTWTRGTYGTEAVRVRQWLADRIPDVRRQIAAKGVACTAGCPAGASEKCQHLACAGVRRCVAGEWTACEPDPMCVAAPPPPTGPKPSPDGGVADGRGTSPDAGPPMNVPTPGGGAGGGGGGGKTGNPATTDAGTGTGGSGGSTPPRTGSPRPSDPGTADEPDTTRRTKSGGCSAGGARPGALALILAAIALRGRRRQRGGIR